MNTMTRPTRSAREILHVEVLDAWFEYLAATHDQPTARYEEVEPWAWTRLRNRLRAIEARRAAIA